jgi:uncharacterized protein with GYD domain
MAQFCHQISYTNVAWNHVAQNPGDRFESVRTPIESLGGRLQATFFTPTDSYHVLAISEFPEDVSPSSIAVAFYARGEVAHIHTTQLLGASDALEAMHKAGGCSYRPESRERALAAYS